MNRVCITIPNEVESEIEKLKKSQFKDEPYSELLRQAIRRGLEHSMLEPIAKKQ